MYSEKPLKNIRDQEQKVSSSPVIGALIIRSATLDDVEMRCHFLFLLTTMQQYLQMHWKLLSSCGSYYVTV
jgi:hypothetical protein